ncbi:hypothetical protein BKA70DRAFT_1228242 [Coprinopsis sp. MPI-PUGE-AT-0042]|nr:hypothetical protein BKA70DRAFT_1228242 [Coprinopsis sp. MPI-PUGE-AT-0042]
MARALRPRKGKQNYAQLLSLPEDNAGPSNSIELEDPDSGSDFAPEKGGQGVADDDDEELEEDELAMDEDIVEPEVKSIDVKGKGKANVEKKKSAIKAVSVGPASSARRQMHTLPTRAGQISDRVSRAWGYNVGPGPLWQLAEDRRWFKESPLSGDGFEEEAKRRPRVYLGLPVMAGWGILDVKSVFGVWDGTAYLPTANEANEDGSLKPAPPVPCHFGSVESQVRRDVRALEAFCCVSPFAERELAEYVPHSTSHVLNAGAPVWALDWCPIHAEDRAARSFKQYLAVAPFPNSSHSPEIGVKAQRPSPACIQIWSLSPSKAVPKDSGPAFDLKWCPLPSHDPKQADRKLKKLGLLGGTFEDGSFCVYVVPDPEDITTREEGPCLIRIDPLLRVELPEAACWSFDWANSQRVAIGTTNGWSELNPPRAVLTNPLGAIVVYDIGRDLSTWNDPNAATITNIRPTHYFTIHQSAVRALAWIQAPPFYASGEQNLHEDPTVIASGGYDGVECLTDVREGRGSIMNRTRVINTLTFSPFAAGPITMDHENTVKSYAASPSMLGRGHTLLEPLALFGIYMLLSTTTLSLLLQPLMERAPPRIPCGRLDAVVQSIYQMDYSRKENQYRMLDCFLPEEVPDARSAVKNTKKNDAPLPQNTGAWSKNVSIHRVRWNNGNGPAASCLLASATASGLCRVDVLWGRWIKDKMPYGGIEQIRMENGDAMDVDSDLSDMESLEDAA